MMDREDADMEQTPDTTDFASGAPLLDDAAAEAAAPSGPRAVARLVVYAPGRQIALAPHTTYALLENPAAVAVPGAARHAYGLLTWQDTRLPLIDLNVLLHPDAGTPTATPRYALIVAYQREAHGPLAYGAIGLSELPQTVLIGDESQCALPDDSRLWPLLALSCFEHQGQAIPIVDTARVFAAQYG